MCAATSSMSMPPSDDAMNTDFPGRAIEHEPGVQLLRDRQRLLDQHLLHQPAFRTGLVGDQRHAEDLPGDLARFPTDPRRASRRRLSSSAGMNLRLDDDLAAELSRAA